MQSFLGLPWTLREISSDPCLGPCLGGLPKLPCLQVQANCNCFSDAHTFDMYLYRLRTHVRNVSVTVTNTRSKCICIGNKHTFEMYLLQIVSISQIYEEKRVCYRNVHNSSNGSCCVATPTDRVTWQLLRCVYVTVTRTCCCLCVLL